LASHKSKSFLRRKSDIDKMQKRRMERKNLQNPEKFGVCSFFVYDGGVLPLNLLQNSTSKASIM